MQELVCKSDLIKEIEKNIEQYDSILIFDSHNKIIENLLKQFIESKALHSTDKKVIIYGYLENVQNDQYKVITKSEYEDSINLYNMYEFSDKFKVISDAFQYGSMLNYLSTGIMSQEEYFEALLH